MCTGNVLILKSSNFKFKAGLTLRRKRFLIWKLSNSKFQVPYVLILRRDRFLILRLNNS